ncbi:MAG: 5-(carboxyamino)imidazole ribonucleotide synthase [Prochlorococcaceae cyanobacterium]
MLAAAAQEMGVPLHVQTPLQSDPATRLAARVVLAPLDDADATRELARGCRAISFENEWLDLEALAPLAAEGVCFLPSLEALAPLINKRHQRELLDQLALRSPRWCFLEDVYPKQSNEAAAAAEAELWSASWNPPIPVLLAEPPLSSGNKPRLPERFSFPMMAKAARGGYDGKGTLLLEDQQALEELLDQVDPGNWILEELVNFEQELSLVACRDQSGAVAMYPLVQTHQHQHICDWVLAPAAVDHAVEAFARNVAASLLTELNYVGVLSIEFFYGPAGLQINELAPRTHNSGHYTIEAAATSQFSQQLRLVGGLPLGSTDLVVPGALMVNLLGFEQSDRDYADERAALAALPSAHLHWYGKQGASPGRKLGHLTVLLDSANPQQRQLEAEATLAGIRAIWPLPQAPHPA